MLEKIKNSLSRFIVTGFLRNSFYRYLHTKIFWRNRYVLTLVGLVVAVSAVTWFLWASRIAISGFAVESGLNFLLNIPWVPRYYSLIFFNIAVSVVNMLLAFFFYRSERVLSYLLMGATLILNISMLLTTLYYIFSLKL